MKYRIFMLSLSFVHKVLALTCLQCKGISQPRHCTIVDVCFPGEVCGVEKVTNSLGHTVFNVGCLTESKCQSRSIRNQRSGNVGCRQCCQSDLCNAEGCGEPGYPEHRGPICFNCPLHTNLNTCSDIAFCEQGDVCKYVVFKEFGDTVHTSECASSHECRINHNQGVAIVGRDLVHFRRSLTEHLCNGCCDTDLCNKGCNGTVLVLDHCSPNPCLHGLCENTAKGFICFCDHSYTGITCATQSVPPSL